MVSCGSDEVGGVPLTTVRGHVVLGPEVHSFEPCDGGRKLWMLPTPELADVYESLSREPYAAIFVEVRGEVGPAHEQGFGADYSEALTVRSLRRAAPAAEGLGCREDLSEVAFAASGEEPFWHLRVTDDVMLWSTPETSVTAVTAGTPRPTPQGWVYEAEAPGAEPIGVRVVLARGRCAGSMVGALYSWTVVVEVDGERHSGCAWEGDLAPR